jgi:hypothetical protein
MTGSEQKCGVVDVGRRLADDLEEFGHEVEAINGGVMECGNIAGCLNLTLGQH